jgi:hypothetical protein
MRASVLVVCTAAFGVLFPCAAQQLRFGIVGGTNLSRDFHTADETYVMSEPDVPDYLLKVHFFSRSHSLILGPYMELSLPRNFSVEVNALHRNLRSTQVVTNLYPDGTRRSYTDQFVSAQTWEFPVLLKYALPAGRARPFVEFGPSFRTWKKVSVEPSDYGVTAGLGFQMNWGKLQAAPVVRYTRWGADGKFPLRPTNSDQVELLCNFSYLTTAGSRRIAGRRLWLGLVGGTSATDGFHVGPYSQPQVESQRIVGGLSLELDLGPRLSLEVDGLYRPLHAETRELFNGSVFRNPFTVLTWEFPVLGKYRLTRSRLAPFVEAGPSLRLSGNTNGYAPSRYGVTAGIGVEAARLGGVKLAPVVRYTRWAKDASNSIYWHTSDYARTAASQVEILLGFSF